MTPSQRSDERPPNPNSADSRRLYAPVGTIVKVFISGMMPRRSDSALPRSNQLMLPERAAPFAGTPVSSRPALDRCRRHARDPPEALPRYRRLARNGHAMASAEWLVGCMFARRVGAARHARDPAEALPRYRHLARIGH